MMKSVFALAALVGSALAQGVVIAYPPDGTTVTAGQSFTVDIARPNSLTPSQEVSVAIGLLSCGDACGSIDVSQRFGNVLYAGPYTPTLHDERGPSFQQFYENFTLTVPEGFPAGRASLGVAHFALIGAGPFPNLDVKNITLNIVA